ncbi:MAG: MipA/OmpV family protein [Gammaproteobacteria bacterium]|nr:MipA/OmpV family protein [Gammaproteobacteria bacterium]
MKKFIALLLPLAVAACLSPATIAQEKTALVPLPSLDDFTKGENGWALGLGLGIEYESAYEGSDEFGFEPEPAGALQWRSGDNIFYFAGEAIGWRGLRNDVWLLEATVGFEEGREEADSDDGFLNGLGDSDEGAEFVLQARRAFDADWRYWLDGRIIAGEDGNIGIFGAGTRFGEQNDGTGHELSVVAVYHDSDRANKDFGINAAQAAASGYNETNLSSGLRSVGLHYNYRSYINENWLMYVEGLYEHYSGDVSDSPITRNDFEAELGVGFIYIF